MSSGFWNHHSTTASTQSSLIETPANQQNSEPKKPTEVPSTIEVESTISHTHNFNSVVYFYTIHNTSANFLSKTTLE